MNIHQIIEKFKSDAAFAAKYSALISVDAILEQAQTDGFDVTPEDVQAAISQLGKQSGELSESELAVVSGGKPTKNRWDAEGCKPIGRPNNRCKGVDIVPCDHISWRLVSSFRLYTCAMGRFRDVTPS